MPDYSLYAIDKHIYKHRTYESNPDSWQVFTSALNTAILFHIATPIYVKDVVSEIECEKTDYQIIHKLYPSIDLPINISHDELHKKRKD